MNILKNSILTRAIAIGLGLIVLFLLTESNSYFERERVTRQHDTYIPSAIINNVDRGLQKVKESKVNSWLEKYEEMFQLN